MAKKKTDEHPEEQTESTETEETTPTEHEPPAPVALAPTPRLEAYIREHDETPRNLATVRLEGGGNGDGTYLVDHPVPRIIGHNGSRYVISSEESAATVYIWANP